MQPTCTNNNYPDCSALENWDVSAYQGRKIQYQHMNLVLVLLCGSQLADAAVSGFFIIILNTEEMAIKYPAGTKVKLVEGIQGIVTHLYYSQDNNQYYLMINGKWYLEDEVIEVIENS